MIHTFVWRNGKVDLALNEKTVADYRFVASLLPLGSVIEVVY